MAQPLPDPIKLLGIAQADIAALLKADSKWLAPLLLQAAGMAWTTPDGRLVYTKGGVFDPELKKSARQALYEWVYAYLEPRFTTYQSWATELAAENYSAGRLEAVGDDGFTPRIFDRGAGTDAFIGWMLASFNEQAARGYVENLSARSPRRPAGAPTTGTTDLGSYHLGKLRWSHVANLSTEQVAAWMQGVMNEGADLRTMGAYNDTMTGNSLADPLSSGWIRVAEPLACAFCLMLASRGYYGILYRSEQTANFRAHSPGKNGGGLCRCHALSVWQAGKVRKLGQTPEYAAGSPYAAYAKDAAVFLEANGARGLIAA